MHQRLRFRSVLRCLYVACHGIDTSLQWRHNEPDGVSNGLPHDCLLNRLFRHIYKNKHLSSASLTILRGVHQWTVNSPHKGPRNAENVSIWWRHHIFKHASFKGKRPSIMILSICSVTAFLRNDFRISSVAWLCTFGYKAIPSVSAYVTSIKKIDQATIQSTIFFLCTCVTWWHLRARRLSTMNVVVHHQGASQTQGVFYTKLSEYLTALPHDISNPRGMALESPDRSELRQAS